MSYSNIVPGGTDEAKISKGKKKASGTSAKLVEANPNRVALIVSSGTKDISLSLGTTAVSGEGIVIREKGPPFILTGYTGAVNVIASAEEPEIGFAEI